MKPHQKLAETKLTAGPVLALYEHDGVYTIRLGGQALRDSSVHAAETLSGEWVGRKLSTRGNPKILLGGLGLGFTLQSVLQKVGPKASVLVAEPNATMVAWNREFLSSLNGELLKDPGVKLVQDDATDLILRSSPGRYDAILLERENGLSAQSRLLSNPDGIQALSTALKAGGRVVICAMGEDRALSERLTKAGFAVEAVPTKLYPTAKRFGATVYIADKEAEIRAEKVKR